MKNTMKAVFTVICCALTAITAFSFAACKSDKDDVLPENPGEPSVGLEIGIDASSGNAYVVSKGTCTDKNIVIPSEYKGKAVVGISDRAFMGDKDVESIYIPGSVTEVGEAAFDGCDNLLEEENGIYYAGRWAVSADEDIESVEIRKGTKGIANNAFGTCDKIKKAVIPGSVKSIGSSAFRGCEEMTSVSFGSGLEYIGSLAFSGCERLAGVRLPDSVKEICGNSFSTATCELVSDESEEGANNKNYYLDGWFMGTKKEEVKKITFRSGTRGIAATSLWRQYKLASADLPEGLKSIGYLAFSHTAITEVTVPASVSYIGDRAFAESSKITAFSVAENNKYYKSVDGNLVDKDGKKFIAYAAGNVQRDKYTYTVPDGITEIAAFAFSNVTTLEKIHLPDSVEVIGPYAFQHCNAAELTVGNGLKEIGECAFWWMSRLTEMVLPSSLETIGRSAFLQCAKLRKVNIPDGIKSIPYHCFYETNISEIVLPGSVEEIGRSAFQECKWLEKVVMSGHMKSIGEWAFCSTPLREITMPETLESIGEGAFVSCPNLQSIVIPEGITVINFDVFGSGYSLENITLPSTLKEIDENSGFSFRKVVHFVYNGTEEQFANIKMPEAIRKKMSGNVQFAA